MNKEPILKKVTRYILMVCLLSAVFVTPTACILAMKLENSPLVLFLFAIGITSCFITFLNLLYNFIQDNKKNDLTEPESKKKYHSKKSLLILSFFSIFTGIFSLLSILNLFVSFIETTNLMVYFIGICFIGMFSYAAIYYFKMRYYPAVLAFGFLNFLLLNAFAYDIFGIPMFYDYFNLIWLVRILLLLLIFATYDNAKYYSQFKNQPTYANIRKHQAWFLWVKNVGVHYISIILFILSWFFSFPI